MGVNLLTLEQVKEAKYDGNYFQALLDYPPFVYWVLIVLTSYFLIKTILVKKKNGGKGNFFGDLSFDIILSFSFMVTVFCVIIIGPLVYQEDKWWIDYVEPYVEGHLPKEETRVINKLAFNEGEKLEAQLYVTYNNQMQKVIVENIKTDIEEDEDPYLSFEYLAEDLEINLFNRRYEKGILNPVLHLSKDFRIK